MFKKLSNIDEYEQQSKKNGESLNKVNKKIKKEIKQNEKPVHPKFIFEGKIKKKINNKNYRKPKGNNDEKKPLITIDEI